MHTPFSPSGHKAKFEYLTWVGMQKRHLLQREAQEELPKIGRKQPSLSIKSSPGIAKSLPCSA